MGITDSMFFIKHIIFCFFGKYKYRFDKDWDDLLKALIKDGELRNSAVENCILFVYKGIWYTVYAGDQLKDYGILYQMGKSAPSQYGAGLDEALRFRPSFVAMNALMELEVTKERIETMERKNTIYNAHKEV